MMSFFLFYICFFSFLDLIALKSFQYEDNANAILVFYR